MPPVDLARATQAFEQVRPAWNVHADKLMDSFADVTRDIERRSANLWKVSHSLDPDPAAREWAEYAAAKSIAGVTELKQQFEGIFGPKSWISEAMDDSIKWARLAHNHARTTDLSIDAAVVGHELLGQANTALRSPLMAMEEGLGGVMYSRLSNPPVPENVEYVIARGYAAHADEQLGRWNDAAANGSGN
jgi:hypothetical protein